MQVRFGLKIVLDKVIREKSRGEGSLIEQDTIFFNFLRKKKSLT